MHYAEFVQRVFRRLQSQFVFRSWLRKWWWQWQGAKIGPKTFVSRWNMVWPHQTAIGHHCIIEDDVFFKFDGIWEPGPSIIIGNRVFLGRGCEFNIRSRIHVSDDCLIGSGCKFVDHNHAMTASGLPMNKQPCPEAPIILEEDVWLGANVVVLKGVRIEKGAVIGAGAVLTKSVRPYEIWVGVPARKIGERS